MAIKWFGNLVKVAFWVWKCIDVGTGSFLLCYLIVSLVPSLKSKLQVEINFPYEVETCTELTTFTLQILTPKCKEECISSLN